MIKRIPVLIGLTLNTKRYSFTIQIITNDSIVRL